MTDERDMPVIRGRQAVIETWGDGVGVPEQLRGKFFIMTMSDKSMYLHKTGYWRNYNSDVYDTREAAEAFLRSLTPPVTDKLDAGDAPGWYECQPEASDELHVVWWDGFDLRYGPKHVEATGLKYCAFRRLTYAAPRVGDGWQAIETAPKDGADFLGCWDDDELHVVCIRNGECYRAMDKEAWSMPTLWQPLPPAPQEPTL